MERSKGVSQRELAKLLEVSRWTIQQVNREGLGGQCSLCTEQISLGNERSQRPRPNRSSCISGYTPTGVLLTIPIIEVMFDAKAKVFDP